MSRGNGRADEKVDQVYTPTEPFPLTFRVIDNISWNPGVTGGKNVEAELTSRPLHRQDNAEFCFPTYHASVAFSGLDERVLFDHRANAGHFRKAQRVLGVGWDPARPAMNSLFADNQLHGRHFDWIRRSSYDDQCAVRPQAPDQCRHRFSTRCSSKDHLRPAEFLQFSGRVHCGTVDINIRAKLFRKCVIAAASYSGNAITGFLGELNSQMTEPANSLDRDKVARQSSAVAESIERSYAGAHQRGGIYIAKRLWHPGQGFHRRNHEFLVASVVADSANLTIRAIHEVSSPARQTSAILAAVPADTYSLALLPVLHACSELVYHASYFMSGNTRIGNSGKESLLGHYITVADSTCLNANPYVSRTRFRDFTFHDFKIGSRLRYLHNFHL